MESIRMESYRKNPKSWVLILYRFFGKAVLGLIQAFGSNWMYFEIGKYWR